MAFLYTPSFNGVLEFYDTGDMTLMNSCEHFMASDVEWDPTGRYVTTSVSWWGHKVNIFSYSLCRETVNSLSQYNFITIF